MKSTEKILKKKTSFLVLFIVVCFCLSTTGVVGQNSKSLNELELVYTVYENEHFTFNSGEISSSVDGEASLRYQNSNYLQELLVIDIENDIILENWMYTPFNTLAKKEIQDVLNDLLVENLEEEQDVEDWMVNLNNW